MSCVKSLCFLFVLLLPSLIQSKEICDFKDVQCITKGARNIYKALVTGVKDLFEPIDPLFIGDIKGEIPDIHFTVSNPQMTGLKDCQVIQLVYPSGEENYEYELYCPQLLLHYGCEVKGIYGPLKLDGNGPVKVTLDNYHIILKGQTERIISEKDQKPQLHVKSHLQVETEPRGKITFEVSNLVKGDQEKSDEVEAYLNNNAKEMEKYLRSLLIADFMKVFIERANIYFTSLPLDELLPRE